MRKLFFLFVLTVILILSGCGRGDTPESFFPHNTNSENSQSTGELSSTEVPESTGMASSTELPETTGMDAPVVVPPVKVFDPYKYISKMTLEEKIGQMFLAGCLDSDPVADIEKYNWGGYILFAKDIRGNTPDSLKAKIDSFQSASKIPLLIAVDEEGGDVCRVSLFSDFRSSKFLSPRVAYNIGGMDRLRQEETEKSLLLKKLGFNVNMAPVCDISFNKSDFMYSRSLGQNASVTSEFVSFVASINAYNNIGSVLKHFPGYGSNGDTHTDIMVDKRPLAEFESKDLIPFYAGIENKCSAILFSHTIVECFDKQTPVSLSVEAHEYVRNKMGFKGVIVTDDIVMQGVTKKYGLEYTAVLAVLSGNDLICTQAPQVHYNAVYDAVKEGTIPVEIIENAVARVLTWKYELGMLPEGE